MKQKIVENIENPEVLEKLYRSNKKDFSGSFSEIAGNYDSELVRFWKLRLQSQTAEVIKSFKKELFVVIILSLITGLLVKIPGIFHGTAEEPFYMRNLAIIVFNGIILYTFWQAGIPDMKKPVIYGSVIVILLVYLNLLPDLKSDSIILSFIHVPLFLWWLFGVVYIDFDHKNKGKWIEFIRFNGELVIMTGLILIAGGLFTAISIGLFSVTGIDVEEFYMQYVVIFGGVASPIISFFLIRLNPNITSRIAPVIARVFTPLVLISLIAYLVSLIFSGISVSDDRNLLLLLNVMLIAVLAIIVFSVSELDKTKEKNINIIFLFLLAILAIVVNAIAFYAIITRSAEGLTPNRTAVIVSNLLILLNLILIAKNLYQSYFKTDRLESLEDTIAGYLTVYAGWTVFVIFFFPLIFGLK